MIDFINISKGDYWDSIVRSFSKYDVYYLSYYAHAFQLNGDGEPLLIHYYNDDSRAIQVVMKRDIANIPSLSGKILTNTYFDFSTPYGYGGFIAEGNIDWVVLQNEYTFYCKENNIVCEFVRFLLLSDYIEQYQGNIMTLTHNVVRDLNISVQDIYMDYEHKVRKNIQKAQRNGLKLFIDYNFDKKDDFLSIYNKTMERTGAKQTFFFKHDFFECLWKMKNNCILFHVLYNDKIISTEIVLYGANNAYSFLGGTDSEFFDYRPNDFLKHEIVLWAKEKGLKNFILGGGYGSDDGIYKYKKSFAPGGIVDYYIGNNIFNEKLYNDLTLLRKQDEDFSEYTNYFPKYRG